MFRELLKIADGKGSRNRPDFVALTRSFGIAGMRADGPDALQGALREALALREPALIEVPVGEMPSPWRLIMHTL